ncbi:MAG: tRNA (N(6)-L-threonylcarbamoyladenosine(37)-C(2))-methylthiotransferase MtaB [Maricaulaceae bacterium]
MNAPRNTVETLTLGCRLNGWESEAIAQAAAKGGLEDVVVVNTCAVTQEAVRQARQTIRRARRDRPGAQLVVTGCAAQIDPESFAAMDEVDRVVGNAEKLDPKTWRAANFAAETEPVRVGDIFSVTETAGHLIDGFATRARAYVQVQNGCNHRCTFCIIPYGRGDSRSVPAGELVSQIRRLVEAGHREVVLTGVDLTSWGEDLPGRPKLGALVRRILAHVPDLPRLRLSSIDAVEIDPGLLDFVIGEPRVAPHLHLSLQAGDDLILKRMKRRHSRAQAVDLCHKVKAARPETAIGADLIAGFPTETEAMFENTLALIEDCTLDYVHVFPFSPRPGTPAARMPQLDRSVIKARAARLREAASQAHHRWLSRHVGETREAIVESGGRARLADFSPVRLPADCPARPGAEIAVRLEAVDGDVLQGAPV